MKPCADLLELRGGHHHKFRYGNPCATAQRVRTLAPSTALEDARRQLLCKGPGNALRGNGSSSTPSTVLSVASSRVANAVAVPSG